MNCKVTNRNEDMVEGGCVKNRIVFFPTRKGDRARVRIFQVNVWHASRNLNCIYVGRTCMCGTKDSTV